MRVHFHSHSIAHLLYFVTFALLIFASSYSYANPMGEGYYQNHNPMGEGYVQDKGIFGLD
jgi:hypothetical protein